MKLDTVTKLIATLVALFVVVSFWSDPTGSAGIFHGFLGSVGGFFSGVIDKGVAFVHGLGAK
jgi:hypothetical protein